MSVRSCWLTVLFSPSVFLLVLSVAKREMLKTPNIISEIRILGERNCGVLV